jgi:hypothetical protein
LGGPVQQAEKRPGFFIAQFEVHAATFPPSLQTDVANPLETEVSPGCDSDFVPEGMRSGASKHISQNARVRPGILLARPDTLALIISRNCIAAGAEHPARGIADALQISADVIIAYLQAAVVIKLSITANRARLSFAADWVGAAFEIAANRSIQSRKRWACASLDQHVPANECGSCRPQSNKTALDGRKVAKDCCRRGAKVRGKK